MSKSERLIGMVLGDAGVPCAKLIAKMLAQSGGDIPDTPTASSYLYGHVADSVVSYNGVELPDIETVWTDKESYPYAVVTYSTYLQTHCLNLNSASAAYTTAFSYAERAFITPKGSLYFTYKLDGAEWVLLDNGTASGVFTVCAEHYTNNGHSTAPLWSSYDLLKTNGTSYLAASEPVYSYKDPDVYIDGVGYVGAVLPNIDEVYTDELKQSHPYAYIVNANGVYVLVFSSTKEEAYSDGNVLVTTSGSAFKYAEGQWTKTNWIAYPGNYPLTWANYDLYYKTADSYGDLSGTLRLAATDPIPVYE